MHKTDVDRMFRPVTDRKVPTYPVYGRGASVIVVNRSEVAKITPAYQQPVNMGGTFSSMFGTVR